MNVTYAAQAARRLIFDGTADDTVGNLPAWAPMEYLEEPAVLALGNTIFEDTGSTYL
jgi:hypothetical protein